MQEKLTKTWKFFGKNGKNLEKLEKTANGRFVVGTISDQQQQQGSLFFGSVTFKQN